LRVRKPEGLEILEKENNQSIMADVMPRDYRDRIFSLVLGAIIILFRKCFGTSGLEAQTVTLRASDVAEECLHSLNLWFRSAPTGQL
jgi:hypothetical protein